MWEVNYCPQFFQGHPVDYGGEGWMWKVNYCPQNSVNNVFRDILQINYIVEGWMGKVSYSPQNSFQGHPVD